MSFPKVTRFGASPLIDSELATKKYVDDSGGGDVFAKVFKTADQTVNGSTVLQDDDELFFTAQANKNYAFLMQAGINSDVTPDLKRAWSFPAGASGTTTDGGDWDSGTVVITQPIGTSRKTTTSGVDRSCMWIGFFQTGGTAGVFQWQWAQNTFEASDTIVLKGSWLLVWEI